MGRLITSQPISINPAISFPITAAWIAATIAIIVALCSARSRKSSSGEKPSPPAPPTSLPPQKTQSETPAEPEMTHKPEHQPPTHKPKETSIDLSMLSQNLSSKSKRRLMVSMSQKIPAKFLKNPVRLREDRQQVQQFDAQETDSIWRKTIILGERCKIPSSAAEAIIYDEKGQQIAAFHPRTPRSLPVSRTNSCIDTDAILL